MAAVRKRVDVSRKFSTVALNRLHGDTELFAQKQMELQQN